MKYIVHSSLLYLFFVIKLHLLLIIYRSNSSFFIDQPDHLFVIIVSDGGEDLQTSKLVLLFKYPTRDTVFKRFRLFSIDTPIVITQLRFAFVQNVLKFHNHIIYIAVVFVLK